MQRQNKYECRKTEKREESAREMTTSAYAMPRNPSRLQDKRGKRMLFVVARRVKSEIELKPHEMRICSLQRQNK